jgi:hypothetical protein
MCDATSRSSDVYKKLGIDRPKRRDDHDPEEDVKIIMKEVQLVKRITTQPIQ